VDALYDAFKHPRAERPSLPPAAVDPPATRPASRATVISQL